MKHRDSWQSEREVRAALKAWGEALKAGEAKRACSLYCSRSSVLFGAVDPGIYKGRSEIEGYFEKLFGTHDLAVTFDDITLDVDADSANCFGTFHILPHGKESCLVRYTLNFRREDREGWVIVSHHGSLLPEASG